jgi:glycosyltransferase involved in cell wall biosynthesis
VRQENAGCGAARNRGLSLARGEFFVPVDADNLAAPHMVETFVRAMRHNPDAVAMTCHFFAFEDGVDIRDEKYLYCYNPLGGPHAYACFENVYGDTNGVFRTAKFRQLGGFEEDRSVTGWEDWVTYVGLINAGQRVGVIPEPLFYYRVREAGQLKQTNGWAREYMLTQKLLAKGFPPELLPEPWDQAALWTTMMSFRHIVGYLNYRVKELENENRGMQSRLRSVRYRLIDKVDGVLKRIPFLRRGLKGAFKLGWKTLKGLRNLLLRRRAVAPGLGATPAAGPTSPEPEKKAA